MKKCSWCGKEYPDDAVACAIDAHSLVAEESQTETASTPGADGQETYRTPYLDLMRWPEAFEPVEGFSRPNWKVIRGAIESSVQRTDWSAAWTEAAIQWIEQLGRELGGKYRVDSSERFILLSERDEDGVVALLRFAETTLFRIQDLLKEAAWKTDPGKQVILLFTEEDDYYQYVAFFGRDGVNPGSLGCLIPSGYAHVAMQCTNGRHIQSTLVHELTHACVVHLPIPLWVNEGLAMTIQRFTAGLQSRILDHELRDRHLEFWNEQNIQKFWSGVSFQEPGDSIELSYSLAEILLKLLLENPENFAAFVLNAHWRDAGQTAALEWLQKDLGTAAATFLGAGNWRPNLKAMARCWEPQKEAEADAAAPAGNQSAEKPDGESASASHCQNNPEPHLAAVHLLEGF